MIDRYKTKEIASIFDEEHKFERWLFVERIVAEVEEQVGIIPKGLSKKLARIRVSPSRISRIEKITNHDVIAFLQAAREKLGKEGSWMHFGLTSYDLVDTAFILSILDAISVILPTVKKIMLALNRLAKKYWHTPMMGRTHGMSAQPISFGYKVASWYEEIKRAYERIQNAKKHIGYGKLSGAVGTYTMLSPAIERRVMKKLKLRAEPVSTQVLPRDRYAFLMATLALYASALERITTEIRNLSRTEIGEVLEPFTKGQKGSSAMPHKKNPVMCERVSGLARVIRGMLVPAYENICLWHERDITNSSVERIIIPDAFHLIHYMSNKILWVLANLTVFPKRMMANIEKSYGVYASQNFMNRLVEHGMNRTAAYKLVQTLSFKAVQKKRNLHEIASENVQVTRRLDKKTLAKAFDLKWFLRNIPKKHKA